MLGVVKITQLAEPEACLVWWADVHRQTIALHEALISTVMSHELLPHWQVNFFKYITLRSTFSFWSLKPKTSAAKIWRHWIHKKKFHQNFSERNTHTLIRNGNTTARVIHIRYYRIHHRTLKTLWGQHEKTNKETSNTTIFSPLINEIQNTS